MPLKAAMWVHRTSVQVEFPERLIAIPEVGQAGFQRGWRTLFQGPQDPNNQTNWFHFALTTPVILDDIRPQLVKVFVFLRCEICSHHQSSSVRWPNASEGIRRP